MHLKKSTGSDGSKHLTAEMLTVTYERRLPKAQTTDDHITQPVCSLYHCTQINDRMLRNNWPVLNECNLLVSLFILKVYAVSSHSAGFGLAPAGGREVAGKQHLFPRIV